MRPSPSTATSEATSTNSLKGVVYEEQGQELEGRRRAYFYYVDHNGRLYLDDTRMRNFTSCQRDIPFLDFFFDHRRFGPNTTAFFKDAFPFISRCGRELNFVRCEDTPIVFQSLRPVATQPTPIKSMGELILPPPNSSSSCTPQDFELVFAGTQTTQFDPARLGMRDGRLYHPTDLPPPLPPLALLCSPLGVHLGALIDFEDPDRPTLRWQGSAYPLQDLTDKHNP